MTLLMVVRYLLTLWMLCVVVRGDDEDDADLIKAAFDGDLSGVKMALSNGANPNFQDAKSGQTALMGSVLRGHVSVVNYLLAHPEVDVTVPEKNGYTLAHGAGFQGRPDVMRILWQAGINVEDDFHTDGFAPLHRACWGTTPRHVETVRVLRDEVGVNVHTLKSRPSDSPVAKEPSTCAQMTKNPEIKALLRQKTKRGTAKPEL